MPVQIKYFTGSIVTINVTFAMPSNFKIAKKFTSLMTHQRIVPFTLCSQGEMFSLMIKV